MKNLIFKIIATILIIPLTPIFLIGAIASYGLSEDNYLTCLKRIYIGYWKEYVTKPF